MDDVPEEKMGENDEEDVAAPDDEDAAPDDAGGGDDDDDVDCLAWQGCLQHCDWCKKKSVKLSVLWW